eukprot:g307.t1
MEALLPELRESESDLLPLGTKVFPSSYRTPNHVQLAGYASALAFVVLLLTAASTSGHHQRVLLVVAFACAGAAMVTLLCLAHRARKRYRLKCAAGTWAEGVFLFPTTGDVVIRLPTLCSSREVSFEKENVQNVFVTRRFKWWRCGEASLIVVQHINGEHEVEAARLVGSATGIADNINAVQRGSSRNIFA